MAEVRYTKDHEWLCLQDDGNVTIGITNHAQEQLGDIVYVELPEVGKSINAGDDAAVVESVKAAGDVKIPLTGEVMEINEQLNDQPELVNSDPEGEGWFLKLKPENTDELANLMDESAYKEYVDSF